MNETSGDEEAGEVVAGRKQVGSSMEERERCESLIMDVDELTERDEPMNEPAERCEMFRTS